MKSFKPYLPAAKLAALLLLGCAHGTYAQTVYRCGNSYSQTPCTGAVPVQVDDARSEAQRQASEQGRARDRALAQSMEASRLQDEKLALERDKLHATVLARQAADAKKREAAPVERVRPARQAARLRTIKVAPAGIFTAVANSPKASQPKTGKGKSKTSSTQR